jgi:hypothetical protein
MHASVAAPVRAGGETLDKGAGHKLSLSHTHTGTVEEYLAALNSVSAEQPATS